MKRAVLALHMLASRNLNVRRSGWRLPSLSVAGVALALSTPPAKAQIATVEQAMAGYNAIKHADLTFANGEPVDIPQLSKRHLLILNFWAYWCGNCIAEFSDLKQLQDRYGPNVVTVVLVSEQKNWDRDMALANRLGITWQIAHYSDAIGVAAKGRMLGGHLENGNLSYALPVSWLIVDDSVATTFNGNPGWTNGVGAQYVASLFK